jgi:hypothetical protein
MGIDTSKRRRIRRKRRAGIALLCENRENLRPDGAALASLGYSFGMEVRRSMKYLFKPKKKFHTIRSSVRDERILRLRLTSSAPQGIKLKRYSFKLYYTFIGKKTRRKSNSCVKTHIIESKTQPPAINQIKSKKTSQKNEF